MLQLQSPYDYDKSPFSGYTRTHWEEIYKILLKGIRKYASPGRAFIKFPGQTSYNGELSDWIEGFARTSFLSGFFLHGRQSAIVSLQGEDFNIAAFYKQGLLNGTDPQSEEYWGEIVDYDQKVVEAAAVALFIYFSKPLVWDNCSLAEKKRIAAWLQTAIGKKVYPNNWMLFNVIVNSVLKSLGENYSSEEIEFNLFEMDKYYIGDGWYRDGVHDVYDYYVGWAIYFYYLLWIKIDGDSFPDLRDKIMTRATKFVNSYRYFFSGDGGYPAYGRSLTYRCAAVSVFPLLEFLGIPSIPTGQARRICSGNLKYFVDKGMITENNYMSLGFHQAYQPLIEPYSGPGSPYWAAKGFTAFLLANDHPFWATKEEELEIEKKSYSVAIHSAGMLLQGDKKTGIVNLYNQKSYKQFPKKYGNFCYSSCFGFEPREINDEYNYDNAISLKEKDSPRTQRQEIHHLLTVENFSASYHYPYKTTDGKEDKNTVVYSAIVLKDDFHVRFHHIITNRKVEIFEGGMPVGLCDTEPDCESSENWEWCSSEFGTSFLQRLTGYDTNVPASGFNGQMEGNHLIFERSLVPAMKRENEFSGDLITGVLVCASPTKFTPQDILQLIKKIKVDNTKIQITFYDGEQVFLQIHDPEIVKITLNDKQLQGRIFYARVSESGDIRQVVQ